MERQILHIVIPSFPIALARTTDSSLRSRPVAVAPLNSERALIQYVSTEAAAEGVTAAMPVFRAKRICPNLLVISPDPAMVAKGNRILAEASSEFTPLVEPTEGRVYLDLTSSRSLFGPARDVAVRLEKEIKTHLGIYATAGSGANKLVSRIAADILPEPGIYDVFNGSERQFLAPFPISTLPGIGQERESLLLRDLNLQRIEQVAALSVAQLRLAVGQFAPLLHERACGIDRSPVQPPRRTNEIVEESYLEQEENDDAILLAELCRLVEACGLRLRQRGKLAGKITLTVCYADGVTDQRTKVFTSPRHLDLSLFAEVETLFLTTCRRRLRVHALRLVCDGMSTINPQMDLFPTADTDSPRQLALQQALDGLRGKYGKEAVQWGRMVRGERDESVATEVPSADLSQYRYCTLTTSAKR